MSKVCLKCKSQVPEDKSSFKCDGCNRFLHMQCANVSATEIKCLQLQNRKLKFFCEDCEEGLLQVPVLRRLIEELQQEVKNLKDQSNDCILENDKIITEVLERQKRSKNLIIYNLPESDAEEPTERKEEDEENTLNIFKKVLDSPVEIKNIVRLGRKRDQVRPVKVILKHTDDVINILKKKRNLRNNTIRIASDQTPAQQELYRKVRLNLEDRKKKGETDIFIKYIKGVPQIIKSN